MDQQGKGIGPFMGILLVAGSMIGSGVFLLPATLAAVGTISALAWVIAAVGAMLMGLTLGYLARIKPGGAFLDSIGQQLGPVPALVCAILYWLATLFTVVAVALAVSGYGGFLIPPLALQPANTWATIGVIWIMVALNQWGAPRVAQWGSATLFLGLVPILLVATAGWMHFDADTFRAGWNVTGRSNGSALFQATLLVFWAFLGFEVASLASCQMRDPDRTVPIATIGGILLASIVYIASTTVIAGMIPALTLASSTAPFADATVIILGGTAAMLVAVAGAAKASGTLGINQLCAIESWLAVQRQAGVNGIGRTSTNLLVGAIASVIALVTASPSVAQQFGIIIGAVVSLSFLIFAAAGLALARARPGRQRAIGCLTIAFCLGLLAAQPADMLVMGAACLIVIGIPALLLGRARGWALLLPAR